jgi:hypothetical protein
LLPGPQLFDAIVAENGGVLHFPASGRSLVLAQPPPPAFLDELRRREVPFLAGDVVVELDAAGADAVLAVIRDLQLPLVQLFNRGRLMILPQAVSKASGLREALRALRLSAHNAVGIGDAENDHELLASCELGVAVAWGSPALEAAADEVIEGSGPADVADFIRRLLDEPRLPASRSGRRRLHLGIREGGEAVTLDMGDGNVLITGDTQSGKSWVAGLLCEQLVLQRYCVCVVDPEGEYAGIEALPSVVVFDLDSPPGFLDVERALRYPDVSVVIDLSKAPADQKADYVRELLLRLRDLRQRTGLPHRIVIDEAHYFLGGVEGRDLLDPELSGHILVTYRPSQLEGEVLRSMDAIVVTSLADPGEARMLHELCGAECDEGEWRETLRSPKIDEAVLIPGTGQEEANWTLFRISARVTNHVRHKHKYRSAPLDLDRAFVFRRRGRPTGRVARSLDELAAVVDREEVFAEHLANHDFSRWIRDVFRDARLAARVREIEDAWAGGTSNDVPEALNEAIEARYGDATVS